MKVCPEHSQIQAFHDGELDTPRRNAVAEHLAQCGECSRYLEQLRQLSGLFGEFKGRVDQQALAPAGLAAVHDAVDASTQPLRIDGGFVRAAAVLMTLAASIVIVSAVWLVELPSGSAVGRGSTASTTLPSSAEPWEHLAMGESVPQPGMRGSQTDVAANWMIDSLRR